MISRRSILFLAFHFPPAKAVGGKRIDRLIRCFDRHGWASAVVAADPVHAEGAEVRHVLAAHLRDIPRIYCPVSRQPLRSRWLDETAGWMRAASRSALELLERPGWRVGDDPVVLFSSSPPPTTHIVALRLKRRLGTRLFWVADFRDPWLYDSSPTFTPWGLINRWLHRQVCRTADLLVGTTDTIVGEISRGRGPGGRGLLLRNTVDSDLFDGIEPVTSVPGGIGLCHFGDLDYAGRNPRSLLRGLGRLRGNGALGKMDCQIHFYGRVGSWNGCSIDDFCTQFGVAQSVFVHDFVPHREALARILGCDVLVLFANSQAAQIPSKVYEYLYANKPILAFCDAGETQRLLRQARTAVVVNHEDEQQVEAALQRIVSEVRAGATRRNDDSFLRGLTTEACFEPFYSDLEARIRAWAR